MKLACVLLWCGLCAGASSARAGADVLYDSLWITDERFMDAGTGNAIGGLNGPLRAVTDVQIADDFVLGGDHRITTVVFDIMAYNDSVPAEGVWVQFYAHDGEGEKPQEKVYAEVVIPRDALGVESIDSPLEFAAWRLTMDLSNAGIELPAGRWWVNSQPLDIKTNGDWFWSIGSVTVPTIGLRSHVRDGAAAHGNSYRGLWNTFTWVPHSFRGNNTVSMRIEGEPLGDSTELETVTMLRGSILGGNVDSLRGSDNASLRTLSGFGQSLTDLHMMEMIVAARTTVDSPASLDVTVESRIDEPAGTARLRLRNWDTNQFVHIATYGIGNSEDTFSVDDLDAPIYVSDTGDIELAIRHIVVVPIFAFTFESFIDWVRIAVE